MKTFNKIIMSLGVAATALGFSACVDDLDREPTNPNEITDVTNSMDRVFADIYLNFSTFGAAGNSPVSGFDGGMASFQRALFIAEELPTDEASWLWDPSSYGTINYGVVAPTIDAVFGFYSRLMINITLCNQFIQSVDNGTYKAAEGESAEAFEARKAEYKRQAKILWGGCYYYMLSFYDKIPYADENTPIGSLPAQLPRAEVYANVTSQLEEIVASYAPNQVPAYGFVGLDAAEAILAKIYLNGEVFAGRADYDKCYAHCDNIIKRLGKGGFENTGLAPSYNGLFGFDNDKYVLGNSKNACNEIIWTLAQDKVNLLSWSGASFLIAGWIGTNGVEVTVPEPTQDQSLDGVIFDGPKGVKRYYKYFADAKEYKDAKNQWDGKDDKGQDLPADKKYKEWQINITETINNIHYSFDPTAKGWISQQWYNAGGVWKCMVARKSFVRKFEWNDPEMSISDDVRVSNWQTSSHGFTAENPSLVGDDWGGNGYLAPKYNNWAYNEDGTINYAGSPEPTEQVGGDYAVIRLAEIYLTAAEAALKGGGGSEAEALKYVNYIRRRAYGDHDHDWTSLTMNDLREERCRELYQENVRRTDLIRWNLWCTGYTWEWKGGVANGTNLPEYTKLYPIPSRVMSSSNFEQTTGY